MLVVNHPLILLIIALCAYTAGLFLAAYRVYRTKPHLLWPLGFLLIGMLCHLVLLTENLYAGSRLNLNLLNIMSLFGWLLVTLTLLFATYRPVLILALFSVPLAMLGLILGNLANTHPLVMTHLHAGVEIHIITSLLALSILAIAFFHSILIHLQQRELKHQTSGRRWTDILPPLQTMEKLLFDLIYIGFGLLSIALFFGVLYIDNLLTQHLSHKTFFSALAWLIFGILIIGRIRLGWRGTVAIRFVQWGFAILFIGFIGSKFVLEYLINK